jgi:putative transposase
MPRYIRASVLSGTFFFTVTLLERRRRLLTECIDDLRAAFVDAAGIGRLPSTQSSSYPTTSTAPLHLDPAAG